MCFQRIISKCLEQWQHFLVPHRAKMTPLKVYYLGIKVCTYTFALENSNEFMVRPHSCTFYQTTQHFSSWSHHCSFFQVRVWSSVSTLYIPSAAYSIRKGWSLIHSRDLIVSFALLEFSQKRPNKPCLAGGGIRATPSKLQNKGLCVALGNSILHSDSGLVWWPPAVNSTSGIHFLLGKATQTELPIPIIGPSDVAKGAWGSPEGWERIGAVPDYPIGRVYLSWEHQLTRRHQKIIKITLDILVKASRKILELLGIFLNLSFG